MAEAAKAKGDAAFTAGKYAKAVDHFSEAIGISPKNHRLYANRWAAHMSLQNYTEALADADKALNLRPRWAKGYAHRCASHAALEKHSEALADAQKAVNLRPTWAKGYGFLAAAYLGCAVAAYKEGLNVDPGNSTFESGLKRAESSLPLPAPVLPFPPPSARKIGREIQAWIGLPPQKFEDCWLYAIKNLISMISNLLYGIGIDLDTDNLVEEYSKSGEGLYESLKLVLEEVIDCGLPILGQKRRFYPFKSVIDVTADRYDSAAIRDHLAKHGAAIVTFPVNRAYQSLRQYNPEDVIDLLHLEGKWKPTPEHDMVGFSTDHTAILCGVEGEDSFLIKNSYGDDFGHNGLVKVKVLFKEIFLIEWTNADSEYLIC